MNESAQQTEYSKAVEATMRAMGDLTDRTNNLLERLKIVTKPKISPSIETDKNADLKIATPCSLVITHLRDITHIANKISNDVSEVLAKIEI